MSSDLLPLFSTIFGTTVKYKDSHSTFFTKMNFSAFLRVIILEFFEEFVFHRLFSKPTFVYCNQLESAIVIW